MDRVKRIEEFSSDLYDSLNRMIRGYGSDDCSIDPKAVQVINLLVANLVIEILTSD